jgi:hypothetical protein
VRKQEALAGRDLEGKSTDLEAKWEAGSCGQDERITQEGACERRDETRDEEGMAEHVLTTRFFANETLVYSRSAFFTRQADAGRAAR